jgi:hypothetical protein
MYFVATILNVIIFKNLNYITINMLTSTPWSLLFFLIIYCFGQADLVLLTIVCFFLPVL